MKKEKKKFKETGKQINNYYRIFRNSAYLTLFLGVLLISVALIIKNVRELSMILTGIFIILLILLNTLFISLQIKNLSNVGEC